MKIKLFLIFSFAFLAASCNTVQTAQPEAGPNTNPSVMAPGATTPPAVTKTLPLVHSPATSTPPNTSGQAQRTSNNPLTKTYSDAKLNFAITVPSNAKITGDANGVTVDGWQIKIKRVNTDSDLQQFLQSEYGASCEFGQMAATNFSTTEDVNITNAQLPGDAGPNDCAIESLIYIKYSPKLKEVATWDAGQDATFTNPDDQTVAGSFHFLQ